MTCCAYSDAPNNCAKSTDGHDKPFCTKAIIDDFKKNLSDIDKSQFLKAISIHNKLSPINFSDKCCNKFSMYLTKFVFGKSNCKYAFLDLSTKESSSQTMLWQ